MEIKQLNQLVKDSEMFNIPTADYFHRLKQNREFIPRKIWEPTTGFSLLRFLLIFPLTKKERRILRKLDDRAKFGFHSRRLIKIAHSLGVSKNLINLYVEKKDEFRRKQDYYRWSNDRLNKNEDERRKSNLDDKNISEVFGLLKEIYREEMNHKNIGVSVRELSFSLNEITHVLLCDCIDRKVGSENVLP